MALYYTTGSIAATTMTAYGGIPWYGAIGGTAGTVYRQQVGQLFGDLLLDNGGLASQTAASYFWYGNRTATTLQPKCPTFFSLTVTGAATYAVLGDPNVFDFDDDHLMCWEEFTLGTRPDRFDTNDDGISDGLAAQFGLSLTGLDSDGDGISNLIERARGSDPIVADTDHDGVADGSDYYPLDPTRTAPPPNPGDVTPPVITTRLPSTLVPLD